LRLEGGAKAGPAVIEAMNRGNDALFVARAALRRAITLRSSADVQVEQMRALVERLELRARVRDE
jgi:hypothetical protein